MEEDRWQLPNRSAHGVSIPAYVTRAGDFTAAYDGETFTATTLTHLDFLLAEAVTAARAEVHFSRLKDGSLGVMRGFHAGTHDVLVTWADGTKGRIGASERVLPADDLELIDRVGSLIAEIQERQALLASLTTTDADGSRVLTARKMLADALGEDLFDRGRDREFEGTRS